MRPLRVLRGLGVIVLGSVVAACSTYPPAPAPAPEKKSDLVCQPVAADEALIGNWLNKRTEKGWSGNYVPCLRYRPMVACCIPNN